MFYARLLVYLLSTYSAAAITGSLDDQPYDAILFRTHLLDRMTLQKLFELKQECNVLNAKVLTTATHYSSTVSNNMKNVVLPAVQYELNILYDHDTIPEFETILASHGFQFNEFSSVSSSSSSESSHQDIRRDRSNHPMVRVTPISLDTFTQYPNVKPLDISKSHYQHLVWTTWWRLNRDRKNWRFVRRIFSLSHFYRINYLSICMSAIYESTFFFYFLILCKYILYRCGVWNMM